jgi:hypothetical protein
MLRFLLTVCTLIASSGVAWAGVDELFPEKVKDFGVSPRGPVLTHYFRFTNTTGQVLNLGQPRVSCGCTSAAVTAFRVAPGESAAVVAYMDTRRITTPYTLKAVTIYVPFFTASSSEEVSLRVQTVCRDDLMMSPDTLAFGSVKKGEGGKATTKVTFASDPNWQVTEATSTGKFVKVEVKQDSRAGSSVTYEVTATLDKDCPAGNWVSDVYLKTSNAGVAQLRIPVTVNVVAPVTVSPDTVQLGDVNLGSVAEKRVTIQSGTPFKILGVKGDDAQLGVKVESPDARPVQVITVSLKPTQAGQFSRSLELRTDNKDQPTVVVPVVAKVVGP